MTTTTTLVSSLNPSVYADMVTFAASVVSDDLINFPGPPTGTVTFFDGAGSIGTRNVDGSGNASLNTSSLDVAGSPHDITAVYNGDGTFDPSTSNHVSQQVNAAPTVTAPSAAAPVGTPWNQLPVTFPIGSVVFTAVVTGGGTPTGTVDFYIDSVKVFTGTLSGAITTFSTEMTGYALGPHSVFMVYSGDANHTGSTSATITQVVIPNCTVRFSANPVTDISGYYGTPNWLVISWPLTNPSVEAEFVRILAWIQTSVTANGTVFYPTGKMTLREGSTVLDTQQLILGNGSNPLFSYVEFNINSLSVGTHMLSVDYEGLIVSGDTYFTPSSTTGYITGVDHLDGIPQVVNPASGGEGPPPPLPPIPPSGPGQPSTPARPEVLPKFTCAEKIDCECLDSPVLNLSSEAVDFPNFFCLNFGEQIPTLGTRFGELSCVTVGNSTVTQEAACLNGVLNSTYCITNTWVPPTIPPPPLPDPIDPPPGTFGNTPQTASVVCPNGQVVSFTVPANTFIAETQDEANAIAFDFAQAYADLLALATPGCSGNPPPVPPPPQVFLNRAISCDAFCADGLAFVYTVHAGTFAAMNQALADRMAYTYACRQAQLRKVCLSALNPASCCLNVLSTIHITATSANISANGNFWEIISGALPPGLSLFPQITGPTATISGTPSVAGSYAFTVRVTLPNGDFMEKAYTLCVVELLPAILPDASPNTPYSQGLSVNCGTVTTWILSSGSLPAGMTLHTDTGIIDGTPTAAGVFTFEVEATTV